MKDVNAGECRPALLTAARASAPAPLHVLLITESIEPSGLGEHMIILAGALPAQVRSTLVFPSSCAGLGSTRRARDAGLEALALPLASLRHGNGTFTALLERVRPDVVHIHAGIPEEGHQLAAAARAWGACAVIRTEHQPYTLRTLKVRTLRVRELEAEYARGVGKLDRIICVSQAARQTFRMAHVDVRFSVVHNGIVPRTAQLPRAVVRAQLGVGEQPLVLTVARFVRQKRHATLLDALPRLLARVPEAILAWVGQGPLEAQLRARALELGVADHILWLGNRGDVPDLMGAADLFCLPSNYEAHPLVILEALAAGLPVVATRALGITETVHDGETGILSPCNNPPLLANALAALLDNAPLRERLRQEGPAWVREQFTAGRMASETLQVYRDTLACLPATPLAVAG